jgi:hypothetical protein
MFGPKVMVVRLIVPRMDAKWDGSDFDLQCTGQRSGNLFLGAFTGFSKS